MEKQTDIIGNVMPRFDLFPRLSATARFLGAFVTQRHETPPRGAEVVLETHMDLEDEQLSFGWTDQGEYLEREA